MRRKRYSIAEARNSLGSVVHEAEAHGVVELTRRGQAVAVVLSMQAYAALNGDHRSFWKDLAALRSEGVPAAVDREFEGARDDSPGRLVDL